MHRCWEIETGQIGRHHKIGPKSTEKGERRVKPPSVGWEFPAQPDHSIIWHTIRTLSEFSRVLASRVRHFIVNSTPTHPLPFSCSFLSPLCVLCVSVVCCCCVVHVLFVVGACRLSFGSKGTVRRTTQERKRKEKEKRKETTKSRYIRRRHTSELKQVRIHMMVYIGRDFVGVALLL